MAKGQRWQTVVRAPAGGRAFGLTTPRPDHRQANPGHKASRATASQACAVVRLDRQPTTPACLRGMRFDWLKVRKPGEVARRSERQTPPKWQSMRLTARNHAQMKWHKVRVRAGQTLTAARDPSQTPGLGEASPPYRSQPQRRGPESSPRLSPLVQPLRRRTGLGCRA